MKQKKIHEWSLGYVWLRHYARWILRFFYSEIVVEGQENISKDTPVIFALNHQNALMDAILVLCSMPQQPVFMARSDIFKKPLIIRILTFLKIMPAYRIRDGFSNLSKNDEVFDKAIDALHDNKTLGIMPEGNHGDQRRLRQLGKGLFRIALKAQEKKGVEPYVKIIPVGLDFSHYYHFRARAIVRFGKPIEVSDYYESYESNQPQAYNELRERIEQAMKQQMLHVESEKYYDTVWTLKEIVKDDLTIPNQTKKNRFLRLFEKEQIIIEKINEHTKDKEQELETIKPLVNRQINGLRGLNIRPWVQGANESMLYLILVSLIHIALLPIFLYGYINNIVAYHLTARLVKNIKDKQFHNSIKYVIFLFVVPFIFIIQSLIVGLAFDSFIVAALYFISLYYTGVLAFDYYIFAKKTIAIWKYKILKILKDSRVVILEQDREQLIKYTKNLTGL